MIWEPGSWPTEPDLRNTTTTSLAVASYLVAPIRADFRGYMVTGYFAPIGTLRGRRARVSSSLDAGEPSRRGGSRRAKAQNVSHLFWREGFLQPSQGFSETLLPPPTLSLPGPTRQTSSQCASHSLGIFFERRG